MGNSKTLGVTLGASNHSERIRADDDFYSTNPVAIDYLLEHEDFDKNIWECACGNGKLSERLKENGFNVKSTDLVYRGYGERESIDFLLQNQVFDGDIITNPPYNLALEFVEKALELSNRKVAMFLKIQFLETKKRYLNLFKENPPKKVLVFVKRMACYREDDTSFRSSAICFCWIIWDKEYDGVTMLDWIDNL